MNESAIQIYRLDNGATEIEVKLDQDTIWLSQKQIAELFDKDSDTIGLHLKKYIAPVNLKNFQLPRITR